MEAQPGKTVNHGKSHDMHSALELYMYQGVVIVVAELAKSQTEVYTDV